MHFENVYNGRRSGKKCHGWTFDKVAFLKFEFSSFEFSVLLHLFDACVSIMVRLVMRHVDVY